MSKSNPPETIIIVILTIKQKWSKDNQSASDVLVEFCPTLKTPTVIWQITPLITAKKKEVRRETMLKYIFWQTQLDDFQSF